MKIMLTESQISSVYEDLAHPLHFLWFSVGELYGIDPAQEAPDSFQIRKKSFLGLMEKLMREGKLKLAKNGVFLTCSIEEQIEIFNNAFPNSDADVDMGGAGTWFFTDSCPGGAVWVEKRASGEEVLEWT